MPNSDGESFKLKLEGPGIIVSTSVDRVTALSVIRVLMGDAAGGGLGPRQGASNGVGEQDADNAPLSLREYLDGVGAKTKVAQIVAIAAYVLDFSGQKDVGRDEIKTRFAEAAEPMPANFPRDFGKVLRAGWMAPTHANKDRFYVTQSGRAALKRGIKE